MKILTLSLLLAISFTAKAESIATKKIIDVNQYIGKWYAISSLPQFFTRKCLYQTAEYDILAEDKISVKNKCFKKRKISTINGEARVLNKKTNAELEVRFYNFFTRLFRVRGDYQIIEIDPNYDFVMVGSSDRKSLWIMSRTKEMPEEVYNQYVERAKELLFPIDHLVHAKF